MRSGVSWESSLWLSDKLLGSKATVNKKVCEPIGLNGNEYPWEKLHDKALKPHASVKAVKAVVTCWNDTGKGYQQVIAQGLQGGGFGME